MTTILILAGTHLVAFAAGWLGRGKYGAKVAAVVQAEAKKV